MHGILSRNFPSTSSNVSTVTPFLVDRRPPSDLGKWANFRRFIWNKEKHTVCNRTVWSWCKIITYYLIFLLLLNGLFFLVMLGAVRHIKQNYKLPWIPKKDLIPGSTPGVAFVPNIIKVNSPLIWYTFKGTQSLRNMKYQKYVEYIDGYLERYDRAENNKEDYVDCSSSQHQNKSCIFHRKSLGPCGEKTFGYENKQPCVYIKVNKLPEWSPEYYAGDDLPNNMPKELQEVIQADPEKKKLWVHCEGIYPPDHEHLGKVSYYPHRGFMGYYFPYTGDGRYLTPLVAVKIDNIKSNVLFSYFCRSDT